MKKLLISLLSFVSAVSLQAQTVNEVEKAIDNEQFGKAKDLLQQLIKKEPDNGEYKFYLGNLYLTTGEDALAKETFTQGATSKKNMHFNYIGLGQIALNQGKPTDAATEFSKAEALIRNKKKDTQELLYISRAYLNSFNPDYAKAAEYARKVVAINPGSAQGNLTLGDAEFNLNNLNGAYAAYRSAYTLDNSLLRAKLHMAVITKSSQAFPEAIQMIDEIIAANPSYAPAYREMAEIHYLWAILDKSVYKEHITSALDFYKKYMTTKNDYSLDSRMRYADFLVLAKDYETLEKEAEEMQKIDKVNPRIFRYLGYSAFENGNYQGAIDALENFIKVVDPHRVLGIDYAYLARSEAKLLLASDVANMDQSKLVNMGKWMRLAEEKGASLEDEIGKVWQKLYQAKEYGLASDVLGALIASPNSGLTEKLYYSNSIFYNAARMAQGENEEESKAKIAEYQSQILKADSVYALVIEGAPDRPDVYYNRARLNRYIPNNEANVEKYFGDFIKVLEDKGPDEINKLSSNKTKLSEAYTNIGLYYLESDPAKALTNITKALEYNPDDPQAAEALKLLQSNNGGAGSTGNTGSTKK